MRSLTAGVVCAVLLAGSAFADPRDDAEAIVEATITPNTFEAAFQALGDLMVGNIQNEVRNAGEQMSPQAAALFNDMFIGASTYAMAEQMKAPMVDVYVMNFSPQMLADYRAFLESPSGKEFLAGQASLMLEAAKVGESIGESIAMPALEIMKIQLADGDVPEGTLKTTENELKRLLGVKAVTQPPL